MAEVNFYLRENTPNKVTAVMLFLSYNKNRIKIGTVERINSKYWDNENQRAKQTKEFPTNPEFNTRLKNCKNKVLDIYRKYLNDHDQQQPLPVTIKNLINAELSEKTEPETIIPFTLVTYAEYIVTQIKEGKRLSQKGKPLSNAIYKIYKTHAGVLKSYQDQKREILSFDNINLDFYHDFVQFLTKTKKFSTNTVGKHVRTLKSILNDATLDRLNTRLDYKRFTAPSEEVDNIYLNPVELEILFNLDLTENNKLERVRDLFLVGCWSGLRFSDFSTITPKNIKGQFIEIKTQKTGKEVVIPIHHTIKEIMKRYEGLTENSLPLAISNQKMNDYLKEVGEIAGLSEIIQKKSKKRKNGVITVILNQVKFNLITTHTARRSFATNMYNMNVPTLTIMAITGHRSESNFMKYIKVTPKEHAIKLQEIWRSQLLKVV
jgi:integrase